MSPEPPALIVGDADDPHVRAVAQQLVAAGRSRPEVVDLDEIQRRGVTLSETGPSVGRTHANPGIDLATPRRGWLRRLHSPTWAFGLVAGDIASVEAAAWHTAFSSALAESRTLWLTDPRDLRTSESKIAQWRTARTLGIRFPKTLVTSDPKEVAETFKGDVVVKPLGAAQFWIDGVTHTSFAHRMDAGDPTLGALRFAPFIVQECLVARRHLRVVTVGNEAWVSALEASPKMATDWRSEAANHHGFRALHGDVEQVVEAALRVASASRLGYSSQDWIETDDGVFLIDVNPSGQWLFLDERVATSISLAIALTLSSPVGEDAT